MNKWMVFFLSIALAGGLFEQFYYHIDPCPLCLLQRLGMIGIAVGALLSMRFGKKFIYYGIAYVSAFGGLSAAVNQTLLHRDPDVAPFGVPILGLPLYIWSLIVFICVILGITVSLFTRKESRFSWTAFVLILIIIVINLWTIALR